MRTRFILPGLVSLAALGACAGSQARVPVVGAEADISQLAGQWYGEYSSSESGRSGSIVFTLSAGSDTATGDVVMTPRMPPQATPGQSPAGGDVSGALAPYPDPTCGCTLHTTFIGRLRADTLQGTYTSLHEQTREVQHGRWRVVRQRS